MERNIAPQKYREARQLRKAHLRERRQLFVTAARPVFAAKGFHQASVREIAQLAGATASSFYKCFASKDDLIDAVCLDECTKLASVVAAAWEFGSPGETLSDLVNGIDDSSDEREKKISRTLMIEVISESNRRPRLPGVLTEIAQGFHNAMTAMVRSSGTAHGDDPDDVARVITNSFFGYMMASQFGEQMRMPEYFSSWASVVSGGQSRPAISPGTHRRSVGN